MGKTSDSQKTLFGIGVALVMVFIGCAMEIFSASEGEVLAGVKLECIGTSLFIVSLCIFSISSCRIKIPRLIKYLMFIYWAVVFIAISVSSLFPVYFQNITYLESGLYNRIVCEYGVVKIVDIVLSVVFGIMAFHVTYQAYRSREKEKNKGIRMMAFANLFPIAGTILAILFRENGYPIMALAVFFTAGVLLFALYRFRLFDTMQMVKDDILETIEDGFVVVDVNQNVLFLNERAKRFFPELKYEATQGQVIEKLIKSDKLVLIVKEKHYQISAVPFYDQKTHKGTTIWMKDITEDYQARRKLIELKEEAEKANDAKTVFLANMSHEIRTPMNAIVGMTELILNDNINSNVEENANNIKSASNNLLSIINGILDFSKIETGNVVMESVDYNLGLVIKDICNMINFRLADKNVELIVHMRESIPSLLRGDETHVRQIFTNILTNAAKYTKRGYIRMNIDWEEENGRAVIKVSVEDTGCGIKDEHIDTLFDSFQRADMIKNRTIEGTGLGLAICKRLVEGMEGKIGVKSSYGVGSVFNFYIKQEIANWEPMGNYDYLELHGGRDSGKKSFIAPLAKILVVDDNITNIKVIRGILTMYQVRVDTALSGKECLEKIEKQNYHMILMDQMMPDMDGIETTKLIRLHQNPEVRNMVVVAVTANAIAGTREMFLQSGFQEYISKPINLSSMEAVLKKYLPQETIHYVEVEEEDTDYSEVEIKIPYVDVEAGLQNYGNDKGRYLQILKFIHDDGPGHLQRIQDYLGTKHYREYVFEVHALKGLMAGIGATQLAEFARIQEFAGRDGNIEVINRESHYMLEQYEAMLENIKTVLNETGMLREEIIQIREQELTWEEFCNMLHSLQGSLDLLEQGEAARKTDNLLTYPLDAGIRKQLIEIKHAINEFEYDEALELVRQLL